MTSDTLPIYLRVADEVERIYARKAPGTGVPSENELAREHAVSRLTARAALMELERRNVVKRTQGRGTFIARRIDYGIGPDTPPSFSRTVRQAGCVPRSETEKIRLRVAPAKIRATLGLAAGASAYFLARRRFVDDEPASYAETWLAADLVPDLERVLAPNGSLFDAFARDYHLEPKRGRTRAEFVVAPLPVARRLGIDARPMVFKLEGTIDSARTGRTVTTTDSWLRADIFRVVFEFGGVS